MPQQPFCLCPTQPWGSGTCVAMIGFLCECWHSNSGPHDLLQVFLPTEPFPHPQKAYLYFNLLLEEEIIQKN